MYSESRNWKWMVPGVTFPLLLLFTRAFFQSPHEWVRWVGVVPGFAALICAIATISNYFIYLRDWNTTFIERKYGVLNETYTARELRAAQGVHPDVARMLLGERDRLWKLKAGDATAGVVPHSVLFDEPDVTDMFFMYFLENSTEKHPMPMHGKLVEGRKNVFDPHKLVDEYTMYRKTIAMLARKRIIVQWSNGSPWEWNQPWDPELAAASWGLELGTVEEEQKAPSVVPTSPPSAGRAPELGGEKKVRVEKELTDGELSEIKALNYARNTMTTKEYEDFCRSKQKGVMSYEQ